MNKFWFKNNNDILTIDIDKFFENIKQFGHTHGTIKVDRNINYHGNLKVYMIYIIDPVWNNRNNKPEYNKRKVIISPWSFDL